MLGRISYFTAAVCILTSSILAESEELVTYPAPDYSYLSGRYTVTLRQGDQVLDSFVYESANPFKEVHQPMAHSNHWTTFSFSGEVEVVVTAHLERSVEAASIRPHAYEIPCKIEGKKISFKLDRPRQVAVSINDNRDNPLFIFAKEIESDIPDPDSPDVLNFAEEPERHREENRPKTLYFPPGVYDLVEIGYDMNKGFPLREGETVYIAGGAVVYGAFSAPDEADHITVRGRGVISGDRYMWVRRRYEEANIPWSYSKYREIAVYLHGQYNKVEGITFTDPVHFCVSVGDNAHVSGIQCFGWWYTTDGVRAGKRSLTENCFFKCNDDFVKVYHDDMVVKNCVFWQQVNGAPFMMSWNLTEPVSGVRVSDCIIMACEVTNDRVWSTNRAVFCCRQLHGADMSDFVFENILIEGDIYRLIGMRIGQAGSLSNITMRNVEVTGRMLNTNQLNAEVGSISGIRVENLTVEGKPITTPEELMLETRGNVSDTQIVWTN